MIGLSSAGPSSHNLSSGCIASPRVPVRLIDSLGKPSGTSPHSPLFCSPPSSSAGTPRFPLHMVVSPPQPLGLQATMPAASDTQQLQALTTALQPPQQIQALMPNPKPAQRPQAPQRAGFAPCPRVAPPQVQMQTASPPQRLSQGIQSPGVIMPVGNWSPRSPQCTPLSPGQLGHDIIGVPVPLQRWPHLRQGRPGSFVATPPICEKAPVSALEYAAKPVLVEHGCQTTECGLDDTPMRRGTI